LDASIQLPLIQIAWNPDARFATRLQLNARHAGMQSPAGSKADERGSHSPQSTKGAPLSRGMPDQLSSGWQKYVSYSHFKRMFSFWSSGFGGQVFPDRRWKKKRLTAYWAADGKADSTSAVGLRRAPRRPAANLRQASSHARTWAIGRQKRQ
jgi:hypothetical protein